jgi:hypothetical protein
MRARASVILQSLATVAAEGGPAAALEGPFAGALVAWRAALAPAATAGGARGAHVLLTRGARVVDPAWPIFAAPPADAAPFAPRLAAPARAHAALARAFAPGAAPPCLEAPEPRAGEGGVLEAALRELRGGGGGGGGEGEGGGLRALLPAAAPAPGGAAAAPAAPPLISIEAGPSLTRALYTQLPPGISEAGADALAWVSRGAPVAHCAVDYLMLSTLHHGGAGVKEAAQGAPLVRREVVDALFACVSEGRVRAAEGEWSFELLRRRAAARQE